MHALFKVTNCANNTCTANTFQCKYHSRHSFATELYNSSEHAKKSCIGTTNNTNVPTVQLRCWRLTDVFVFLFVFVFVFYLFFFYFYFVCIFLYLWEVHSLHLGFTALCQCQLYHSHKTYLYLYCTLYFVFVFVFLIAFVFVIVTGNRDLVTNKQAGKAVLH